LVCLANGIEVSANIGRVREQFRPLEIKIAKDIQENLAEFHSLKWVAENIPVANVPVNPEQSFVAR
jgi:hypothetical protein